MYDINLNISHFPLQLDTDIRDITVGGLLREVAASNPDAVAMVDVLDNGDCSQSWSYAEVLARSERLAKALATRFETGERVVVWASNIPEWIFMEYACGLAAGSGYRQSLLSGRRTKVCSGAIRCCGPVHG